MNNTQTNENERIYQSFFDDITDGIICIDLDTNRVVEANLSACLMHGYPRKEMIGTDLTTLIHTDDLPYFNEKLKDFQSEVEFEIQTRHICKDGSTFYSEWRGTASSFQNRPVLLGVFRDITKSFEEDRQLHQHVENHALEQEKLLEISHTLASSLEFQPGLILEKLREILKFDLGGLFVFKNSSLVSLIICEKNKIAHTPSFRIHLKNSESQKLLFNGHRPIRITDIDSDKHLAEFMRSIFQSEKVNLLKDRQSLLWVPLAVKGRITGGFLFVGNNKSQFSPHHGDLALSAADQTAITMVNAKLYNQAKALAVLEERQRLARNLHDAVNQSLFSAGLIAEVLPRLWERDPEDARKSLEDLRRLTRGAQAEMRALLAELRPSTITDSNLGELLILLGNALSGKINIPVNVQSSIEYPFPAEVQIALYRICQEAFSNITKHAKAKQVDVSLTEKGSLIELRISDNGQGFDTTRSTSGHYGLGMMRERADGIGAEFFITSQPGVGTEITIHLAKNLPKEGR